MANYKPRYDAPSALDKNYLHTSAGGYNSCLLIKNGSCLPNCVGYAWGRWRELLGKNPKLSRANAENWWNYNDGYKRGQTPKVGAVICWQKGATLSGKDGAGHVAIVEQVFADGSIMTSNSGYGGSRFYLKKYAPPYSNGSAYTFQGFIYLPVEFGAKEGDTVNIELDILRNGSKGEQVKTLQRLLLALGYKMDNYGVDGSFGGATERAVKAFQKASNIKQDGIVGLYTWRALLK